MIERMKSVCVVASQSSKNEMLKAVRDLGVLHLSDKKQADTALTDRFNNLTKTLMLLNEFEVSSYSEDTLTDLQFTALDDSVQRAVARKKEISDKLVRTVLDAESIRAWGDFEPSLIDELKKNNINLYFYRMGKREISDLEKDENVKFIRLACVEKMETVAVVGQPLDKNFPATLFNIPSKSLSSLEKEATLYRDYISECDSLLKESAQYVPAYRKKIVECKNKMAFSSADRTSVSDDGLVWLSGYIPADDQQKFEETANKNCWAYLIQDPDEDDEKIPTKVRYTKVTSLMRPVFSILGTVPGYKEYDISFWFLCFFALFFAMIIGDAGYGFIFLSVGVALHVKQKKTSDVVLLLYVLSIANIVWGALTGTWFGLESAMQIPLLKAFVIPAIANYPAYFGVDAVVAQNNLMQFCFIIGTVQLSLACIMNVKTKVKEKNLSWVSDIGWLCSINAIYYVVLLLVIGADVNIVPAFAVIGLGFVLVVVFGGMSPDKTFVQGLKSGLADAFTVFLNTISAFGNIMSYIRLFAVGMASLAIAQSFNSMAGGFTGFLKVAGVLIFIIGHALNLVMGLLSVVVHGVRLNLLEFSGQLGMEWSGIAYEPFSEIKK